MSAFPLRNHAVTIFRLTPHACVAGLDLGKKCPRKEGCYFLYYLLYNEKRNKRLHT